VVHRCIVLQLELGTVIPGYPDGISVPCV